MDLVPGREAFQLKGRTAVMMTSCWPRPWSGVGHPGKTGHPEKMPHIGFHKNVPTQILDSISIQACIDLAQETYDIRKLPSSSFLQASFCEQASIHSPFISNLAWRPLVAMWHPLYATTRTLVQRKSGGIVEFSESRLTRRRIQR